MGGFPNYIGIRYTVPVLIPLFSYRLFAEELDKTYQAISAKHGVGFSLSRNIRKYPTFSALYKVFKAWRSALDGNQAIQITYLPKNVELFGPWAAKNYPRSSSNDKEHKIHHKLMCLLTSIAENHPEGPKEEYKTPGG